MILVTMALGVMAATRPTTVPFLLLLAVIGVGLGLFTSPNNASIMGAAPAQHAGMASGVLNMSRGIWDRTRPCPDGIDLHGCRGDSGPMERAAHAFSVTAFVLALIAAAAGVVSGLRSNGVLAQASLASVE